MSPTELGSGDPDAIVFASNTHDFLIRLVAAARVAKLAAARADQRRRIPLRPAADGALGGGRAAIVDQGRRRAVRRLFRALPRARRRAGEHDLILVSQVLFNSGRSFDRVAELAALARPEGPWVVIDGYHAFMAIEPPIGDVAAQLGLLPRRRL